MPDLNVRDWVNGLDNLRRRANCDREVGDVLCDHTSSPNGTTLADRDAGHDGYVAAYPAVIFDGDGSGIFDTISPRLDAYLMCGRKDGDEWAEHNAVADGDEAAVQYHQTWWNM